jgi:hypothetical protein
MFHSIENQLRQAQYAIKNRLKEIDMCEQGNKEALQRKCEDELFITEIHDEKSTHVKQKR